MKSAVILSSRFSVILSSRFPVILSEAKDLPSHSIIVYQASLQYYLSLVIRKLSE